MRLAVQTLETFGTLARDGSNAAAGALSQLTGDEARVEVTRVDLVSATDLAEEYAGTEFVGAAIELSDGLSGTVVLVFDQANAETLLDSIVPDSWDTVSEPLSRSGVSETANIMVGGFVDAWAEYFETKITPGAPQYLAGAWPEILPSDLPVLGDGQSVLSVTSQLTATAETVDFQLYFFPERDSLKRLMDSSGAVPVSLEKLGAFNTLAGTGARRAAEKITEMTGIETTVDITRLTFIPTDSVAEYLPTGPRIGAVTHLQGPPGGHIVILFDPASARTIGDALLPVDAGTDQLTDQHRMALQEISNIMTSGFIDGWANTVERKIQHVPPELREQSGAEIVTDLVADSSGTTSHYLLFDSTVKTPDQTVNCELVALPDPDEFEELLTELSVEAATEAIKDPTTLEPQSYDDLRE